MSWQDFLVGLSSLFFVGALIVQVRSPNKPPLGTGIQYLAALSGLAVAYASLHLWFALVVVLVQIILWLVVVSQRLRINQKAG